MPIPEHIVIKNKSLPDTPGVYLYYDKSDKLLYIGKATSLRKRVSSYFSKKYQKADDTYAQRIGMMVSEIVRIDYIETPTVIEALVLEANLIRSRRPYYNVRLMDDKSFLYLVFTNEDFPKPLYVRGLDLSRKGIDPFTKTKTKEYLAIYGPFTSPHALKKSMELLRRIFPWSVCSLPKEGKRIRPCFDAHIRKCPGVCMGAISKRDYRKSIRSLMQFFDGKKRSIVTKLKREMNAASDKLEFEKAGKIKRQIRWLEHIQDIAVVTKDFSPLPYEHPDGDYIDALGRIEAYDVSNISGTSATGSMVVFIKGRAMKSEYRKFKIKTVDGPNDVAMMKEVISRRIARAKRFPNAWPLPDMFVIDGGKPQVNVVARLLEDAGINVPVVGLAKGPDRKQDELIFDKSNRDLARVVYAHKETFQKARDEAHRFAVKYHRKLRSKR
jgi:excinuclease ABC subunit C